MLVSKNAENSKRGARLFQIGTVVQIFSYLWFLILIIIAQRRVSIRRLNSVATHVYFTISYVAGLCILVSVDAKLVFVNRLHCLYFVKTTGTLVIQNPRSIKGRRNFEFKRSKCCISNIGVDRFSDFCFRPTLSSWKRYHCLLLADFGV